jgi:two-component system chemotaxis response regulator CheB
VIGIVLSGALNDGTAGLAAIKRCGGLAIVQDPKDAAVPSMPQAALAHVAIDHCLPIARMAELLARLVTLPAMLAAKSREFERLRGRATSRS